MLESRLEALRRKIEELRGRADLDEVTTLSELESALDELEEIGRLVEEGGSRG
ncbi:MAG: hypothetical protein WHT46_04520 [Candidatus Geothermincolales bacterium]